MKKKLFIGLSGVVIAALCSAFFVLGKGPSDKEKTELGKTIVDMMYSFDNKEVLYNNYKSIESMVTEDVFNQISVDNEEKTLRTYVSWKAEPCIVDFVQCTPDHVLFRLKSDGIEVDRLFLFVFNVNDDGIIDYVKEGEVYEYYNSYNQDN